jgi:hypothetical protein
MAVASILEGVGQGALMPTYDDLIELAEICLKQARAAKSRAVATELRRMAKDKLFLTAWRTRGLAIPPAVVPGCSRCY